MAEQELRDGNDRLIGTIADLADGTCEGRDASGLLRGTYHPKTNETRDADGRLVGTGNMLSTLIMRKHG